MSRFENHNLAHRKRAESDKRDADCSCARWHMRNSALEEIRRSHAEHVQHELGPDRMEAMSER